MSQSARGNLDSYCKNDYGFVWYMIYDNRPILDLKRAMETFERKMSSKIKYLICNDITLLANCWNKSLQIITFDVVRTHSKYRLESRSYGTTLIQWMNGSWDVYLASPADFAGLDVIITNLAKERENLGSRSSNAFPKLWLLLVFIITLFVLNVVLINY